jgi:hypothetical protein
MIEDGSILSNFRNELILTLTFENQVFAFKIKLLDIKTTSNLFQPNTYIVATNQRQELRRFARQSYESALGSVPIELSEMRSDLFVLPRNVCLSCTDKNMPNIASNNATGTDSKLDTA